ncbi:MAG TPA: 1-(5-phosphoribosyl)-5-[(5-phosphoribosylamino)methylideneamino] imidazole-4-carboxamide isomerase [Candidatus Limnocylindrales bacterium]
MGFQVLPAIDLRGGRVVRLVQGDFGRETAYPTDPVATADDFAVAGAAWLHVVDLDGARGLPRQTDVVEAIVQGTAGRLRCQVGGGLRTEAAVAATLDAGASRVVIGTAALADTEFIRRLVASYGPDRIAVALDVRDGLAVGDGWLEGAPGRPVREALEELAAAGIEQFVVTSIVRDGGLGGPDLDLLGRLVAAGGGAIVASGGIASIEDILAVRDLGCAGAIVGRALYEGRLDLRAAIDALSPSPS